MNLDIFQLSESLFWHRTSHICSIENSPWSEMQPPFPPGSSSTTALWTFSFTARSLVYRFQLLNVIAPPVYRNHTVVQRKKRRRRMTRVNEQPWPIRRISRLTLFFFFTPPRVRCRWSRCDWWIASATNPRTARCTSRPRISSSWRATPTTRPRPARRSGWADLRTTESCQGHTWPDSVIRNAPFSLLMFIF